VGGTRPPSCGTAYTSAVSEPGTVLLGKVQCLKSNRLVFSRQRAEVSFKCVMGLSLLIHWKLYATLKGPGNCKGDWQPLAARRLTYVVKGTFPEKLERELWAGKG